MKINKFHFAAVGIFLLVITGYTVQAQSISMSYVTVGNPGNAGDPASRSGAFGSVSYTYDIGEYDVTDSQYCTFLNAVDPSGANLLGLYSPQGDVEFGISQNLGSASGSKYTVISGYGNMPVVDVDYWDTLRFANYLDDGNTETGAYTLLGGSATPSNASTLVNSQPNVGATVWLPSVNEWYKAAYYDPLLSGSGGYYMYATQSNTAPGNIIGSSSNEANFVTSNGAYSVTQSSTYVSSTNYLTAVGSFTGSKSYYGTYDQSGDVFNWTSGAHLVDGAWNDNSDGEPSSYAGSYLSPPNEFDNLGFRVAGVAPVPEPSTWTLMAAGAGGMIGFCRRRRL